MFLGPKRQAWDYKGRLEDMEEYVRSLSQTLEATDERLVMLESNNNQLEGTVEMKEKEFEKVNF